jgi:hypothetical protein
LSRQAIFEREEIEGMRGLASLTEPADDEPVGAIVDLAVMGARGDGKTQFIVHAIRTLRAYGPPLGGVERDFHRDILEVVMNAHAPRPEATPPGVVPHYVFRIRPESLLGQIGLGARLGLYRRTAGLLGHWLLALVNAVLLGAALAAMRGSADAVAAVGAGLAFALGATLGTLVARRRFVRRGLIEIVFWDVAGEHVYRGSAADYYGFLGALVAERRQRASADRAYAFAPVLLCNPTSLGTRAQGSSYTRLRQILPMFASLNELLPRALVAINRWAVVDHVCAPEADRDEIVAVLPRSRAATGAARPGVESATSTAPTEVQPIERPAGDPSALPPLPAVRRDVLRAHCLDAEDGRDSEVDVAYLRYDAGMQCEIDERPWPGWDSVDGEVKAQWQAPAEGTPHRLLDYVYEDGPGAFEGEARSELLRWLGQLAFHPRSYAPARPGRADEPRAEKPPGRDASSSAADAWIRSGMARPAPDDAGPRPRAGSRPEGKSSARPGDVDAGPNVRGARDVRDAGRDDRVGASPGAGGDAGWRPDERAQPARALSASGLEDFARGAIANAIEEDAAAPAGERSARAPDGPDARDTRDTRDKAMIMPVGEQRAAEGAGGRREKKSDTLPMPGGFGSSGT